MIECWLSFNNRQEVIQLPITPFFIINGSQLNQTLTLHNIGEINLPGKKGLKTLTIESFIPEQGKGYQFLSTNEPIEPFKFCQTIERWKNTQKPIRVVFTETDINLPMLIEAFSYGMRDGTKDVYYTIELKEFVFLSARKIATVEKNPTHKSKTWTVKYGDTLSKIALSTWNDSTKYKKIIELNKDKIKNPNSLKSLVGQVLRLE